MAATAHLVRPARDGELSRAVEALRRAGFGGPWILRLVHYPWGSPDGTVLIAEGRRGVEGVACCASFGGTGWIGALGVVPAVRRHGLGAALTEAATSWLHERGAITVLLYATDMGRPVYERLGFEHDGGATAWRGVGGRLRRTGDIRLRPLDEDDRAAVCAIDRRVTGEDRRAVLDGVALGGRGAAAAIDRDGVLRGWAAASPWSSGAAVCALDAQSGLALLSSVTAGPVPETVVLPDANREGHDALRAWGFARLNAAARMRLGPAPAWHPEQQYGLFNLFWG